MCSLDVPISGPMLPEAALSFAEKIEKKLFPGLESIAGKFLDS